MTTIVSELYEALKAAGVNDDHARAAARAVMAAEDKEALATRADLRELRLEVQRDIEALKAELTRWVLGAMVSLTGIFALVVAWLVKK